MKNSFILLCVLGLASLSAAYTATDSCTGTTSCSLAGTHAATDIVIVWAYRAASATAPTLGSGFTNITNGSSATGASRSWRSGCIIAGTTGSVSTQTWTNATNVVAFAISGTGATTTGNCVTNGIGTVGTANSVSSATATYSALTMSASPTATSIPLLVMGSSTSGQTCTPTGATVINNTGDVRASLANATGNWSSTTCAITSSVTTEIVIELKAALVATPTFSPNGGTFGTSASETLSDTTGGAAICYTTDGSTPAAATAGTCSAGSTYSSPFSVATDATTLKALGTAAALANSAVATSSAFSINPFLPNLASLGASGGAPLTGIFSPVQAKRNTSCGASSTCAITISTTSANNLLYFEAYAQNAVALVSVDKGGTLVVPTSCQGNQAAEAWSCGYILPSGSSAATTPITLTFSGPTGSYGGATMWELHPSANYTHVGLEADGFAFVGSSANPVGPAFTVTGAGAAALHTAGGVANENSVAAPYTSDFTTAIGVAHNLSSTGAGPVWTMASSTDTALEGGIFSWNPLPCDDIVYMDQSGGSNGANPTTTTLTNSTYGFSIWSKNGSGNPFTWVTDTTGPNMQAAIRPCGSGVTRDGTMGLNLHYDLSVANGASNEFFYPLSGMSPAVSIGYWWKTDLLHTDITRYIGTITMLNGTGNDSLMLMCHAGECYPEVFDDPNGNPVSCSGSSCNGNNKFNFTENTWYWITYQMNIYVSSSTHNILSIYSNANPPILLARMEKVAGAGTPHHNPNELHLEAGDDIGTSARSVDIRGLKINLNGTFPLLP